MKLRLSAQYSIDAFLEHRSEYTDIGKAMIAHFLVARELEKNLYGGPNNWYRYVLDRMTTSFRDFGQNQVSFVTFNYDRSLEHFFFTALLNRYGKSFEETADMVRTIPIIHVHGYLALLEWQASTESEKELVRPYSPAATPETVRIAADSIDIIHGVNADTPEFNKAHNVLDEAERIYFLGFGYHPMNMRRLNIDFNRNRDICGSCFGLTEAEKQGLKGRYSSLILRNAIFRSLEFLRQENSFQVD